jgi:hypothetical protein
MNSFEDWYKENKVILKHLYYELINICSNHCVKIINNDRAIDDFNRMMYIESNKEIIDKKFYPEFFCKKINSKGYEKIITT